MVNSLNLWNFPAGTTQEVVVSEACFELKTCQRTLILGRQERPFGPADLPLHERAEGHEAYLYLLETICGMKSKLLGENEIVAQFKEAYKAYALHPARDPHLLLILEKLLKDAKEIRTAHMVGLGMKTYASLTRRHLVGRMRADRVLILGSGALAEDLINQFKKHAQVVICARNRARVLELTQQHGIQSIPWDDKNAWSEFPYIANTIGFEGVLLDQTFFSLWQARHFHRLMVDLGSPSCLVTSLSPEQGLLRLDNILAEGALVEEQKMERLQLAREAMREIVERRTRWLEQRQLKWQAARAKPQLDFAPNALS